MAEPNGGDSPPPKRKYKPVMEKLFFDRYVEQSTEVDFSREDIDVTAESLDVDPKNLGDLVYYFRYRAKLPESVRKKAPAKHVWIIRGVGNAKYRLVAVPEDYAFIRPRSGMVEIKVPDATPGIIGLYARREEQALLAKVRYNRLIDIFLGIACYSLQSHLRTKIEGIGQLETDEIYVGLDREGAHYVVPVQAKGGHDKHSIVQVEQDFELCATAAPFDKAICRPVAAQFIGADRIALFSFARGPNKEANIMAEKHYRLVPPDQLTEAELASYRQEALKASNA